MYTPPPDGSSRPARMRRAVVLPQPEGPTRTMNSPSWTSSEKSSRAATSPNFFVTWSKRTPTVCSWPGYRPLLWQAKACFVAGSTKPPFISSGALLWVSGAFALLRYRFIPNRGGVASSYPPDWISARTPRLRAFPFQRVTGRAPDLPRLHTAYPLRLSYLLSPTFYLRQSAVAEPFGTFAATSQKHPHAFRAVR